jgi:two-component system nitrogen regulation response regulator GlnG
VVDAKVIVIEPSDLEATALQALLHFLDLEPVLIRDLAELRASAHCNSTEYLAVIARRETVAALGLELVTQLRSMRQPLPIICISADGLPKIAETSSDVAWFHLETPVKQRRLSAVLNQAQNVRSGHPTQPGAYRFRPSGASKPMRAVHRLIEQVAPFDTNVLILGESGTGKEMVARHIHELSGRAAHPFVPVNCGAIPADLLESELFGHEKGAFTGALSTRLGRFEFAEGGTLFLDEIGDMPPEAQTRLLRVLQEGEFTSVGGRQPIKANVRIIAATHRDLRSAIRQGQFREDLFYRLNVVPIRLPPLRERVEDVALLARHFLERAREDGLPAKSLDQGAVDRLKQYAWPGNVRELENLMRRLAALCPDEVIGAEVIDSELADPPPAAGPAASAPDNGPETLSSAVERHIKEFLAAHNDGMGVTDVYDKIIAEVERPLIRLTLAATRGNQIKAASMLGLNRNTLRKKIRDLEIPVVRGLM